MTHLDELRSLAKRVCEEAPSRELDLAVSNLAFSDYDIVTLDENGVFWSSEKIPVQIPFYTISLDAAASLMLAWWDVDVCVFVGHATVRAFRNSPPLTTTDVIRAPTEPQARTAAALLAMAVDLENENLSSLDDASNTIQKVFGLEADDAAQIGLGRYGTGIVSNTSEQDFENDK
jgi:hypothetical protein